MHIHKELKKSTFIFKSINIHDPNERIFSGWGSVEIIDNQGDLIPIKEFEPVMKILMRRGAPIVDSHSNHKVGEIISYKFRDNEKGERGLYLTAKIYKDYPTDDEVWEGIKNGDYAGFSLGGKAGEKIPICNREGCYNVVKDIEAWEFSVVERPANQKSLIDHVNKLAKSDKVIYIVKDNRVYIKNPSKAPKGVKVERGKRGGYYYEEPLHAPKIEDNKLKTVEIEQSGLKFKTGNPVKFDYIRNPQPPPKGIDPDRFGQKIEPGGKYINFKESDYIPDGWQSGKVHFNNPIVLEWGTTSSESHGWKNRLSQHFGGKTGKKLTTVIINAGYDGIITVDGDHTSEIVDLSSTKKSYIIKNQHIIQKPFTEYKDFDTCVSQNRDKHTPEPYCGTIKYRVEKGMVRISSPSDAPSGVRIERGPRGGYYYDSEGQPEQHSQTILRNYARIKTSKLSGQLKNIAKQLKENKSSKYEYFDSDKKEYTPERKALHENIINSFIGKNSKSVGKPKAVLVGGPTASGKTSILKHLDIDFDDYVSINNDDIKEKLPGYNGVNAALYHNEARDILNNLIDKSISEHRNLIIDGTMRDYEKEQKKIGALRKIGYIVRVIGTKLDTNTVINRTTTRFLEEEGRYVPLQHIAKTTPIINETLPKYEKLVDNFELWDSSKSPPTKVV